MSYYQANSALNAYRQVGAQAAVAGATPHMLVKMLMQGALDRTARARGCMERGDMEKGRLISSVLSIVDELAHSLNFEAGGEIAENLGRLYEYMQRRLLQANLNNDASILDEISSLLHEIKGAWDALPELAQEGYPKSGTA